MSRTIGSATSNDITIAALEDRVILREIVIELLGIKQTNLTNDITQFKINYIKCYIGEEVYKSNLTVLNSMLDVINKGLQNERRKLKRNKNKLNKLTSVEVRSIK